MVSGSRGLCAAYSGRAYVSHGLGKLCNSDLICFSRPLKFWHRPLRSLSEGRARPLSSAAVLVVRWRFSGSPLNHATWPYRFLLHCSVAVADAPFDPPRSYLTPQVPRYNEEAHKNSAPAGRPMPSVPSPHLRECDTDVVPSAMPSLSPEYRTIFSD